MTVRDLNEWVGRSVTGNVIRWVPGKGGGRAGVCTKVTGRVVAVVEPDQFGNALAVKRSTDGVFEFDGLVSPLWSEHGPYETPLVGGCKDGNELQLDLMG